MHLYGNKYSLIKDGGNGGFGKVFLAQEKVSNRNVAIKQLLNTNKSEQEDIIHEIEIVSKFENSNIVTYYHHFYEEETLYLVMEFCSGGTLREKISNKKVTATLAIEWVQILTTYLRVIHKKAIIHHDIKPENIPLALVCNECLLYL
jgi:serine/threonine protein kinase